MPEPFVHLHRHGEFSRLDGIGTAKEYAERAKKIDQGLLAQTDHGTLSGALHHITACRKEGIVPIVGVEAYYRPDRTSRMTRSAWHLILLAKNMKGWNNLLRLVSTAYADPTEGGGFYQVPCVDDDLLDRYHEGLICTSACSLSWLSKMILAGDDVAAIDYINKMKSRFGDDFWLEISPHDFDDQRTLNMALMSLGEDTSTGVISTNDVHFVKPKWAETQRIAKMMGVKLTFKKVAEMLEKGEEPSYMAELIPNLYLSTRDEMTTWYENFHPGLSDRDVEESLDNTVLLAKSIKPFMLDKSSKIPKITNTAREAEDLLSAWIDEGLERIKDEYPEKHWDKYALETYNERIDFEWDILKDKGVIPYMVMVGDIVRWCKSQGIRTGLGRGSAAGCMISYLVGITAVDPIPWGLLFERFLNPGRKGLPDIDIDVQSDRRAEVKAYIVEKYGADHVADIITHERFQPKSVLQDLCRVYDVPYMEAHAVTDTIDIRQDDEETTLEELLPLNDKLKEFKEKYPEIWTHALRLEGSVKNMGKHAAGVVITPNPIVNYMALERGKKGDLVTSWSDAADFMVISDYGFLKIDLLGLKGLTKHDYACKLIKERHGIDIDLNKLPPLRDPMDVDGAVMQIFRDGFTSGVFQFGSKGITQLLRDISPDNALDLAAANALYRPGPMKGGSTWDYARIKHGRKEQEEWTRNPVLDGILDETYGLMAYQEQIMEVSKRLAGFSPAQADDLRKAMGKLYRIKGGSAAREYMSKYEIIWFEGTAKNGVAKALSKDIWKNVLDKGSYTFNKSHSGSYSLEAYQDAWLKEHYPLEFYASTLTFPSGSSPQAKQDFISGMVREARQRGAKILPPDINKSDMAWTIDDEADALLFGFVGIKDVGEVAAAKIVNNRGSGFNSQDHVREKCGNKVNAKVMTALTEAGAFDQFDARKNASGKQIALWEKDRLKMVIKGTSETEKYAHIIQPNIFTQDEVIGLPSGSEVIVGGEITKIERKQTKNGNPFANATIVFEMNEWRIKLWSNALAAYDSLLVLGNAVMVSGKKDEWKGYVSVVCQDMTSLEDMADEVDEEKSDEDVGPPPGLFS